MLTNHQRAARRRRDKERRIALLSGRLDRHVAAAEKFRRGSTREHHLALAETARAELRELDH